MRRISLMHVGVAMLVLGLLLIGVLAVKSKLSWSWSALGLYLDGTTTTPPERSWELAALAMLQTQSPADEIEPLLVETIEVDPNSASVFYLGELMLREGNVEAAERQYLAYLEIDAAYMPAYERLAGIYERQGRLEDREHLLSDGLAWVESNIDAYRPQRDPDVAVVFNDKADGVHNGWLETAARLRALLESGSD